MPTKLTLNIEGAQGCSPASCPFYAAPVGNDDAYVAGLGIVHLCHDLIDGHIDIDEGDVHCPRLPNPVCAIHGLLVHAGVEPSVKEKFDPKPVLFGSPDELPLQLPPHPCV